MKTIGILGGLGPESTIAYYSYITRKYYEIYKDYAYPDIIIYNLSFREFIKSGYELPGKVRQTIEKLYQAGADFVVASCNSVHIVYDQIAPDLPIPWISIMDVTAQQIKKVGFTKVALLGTILTMSKGFYQKSLARQGLETITPNNQQQNILNRIIYDELVTGTVKEDSRKIVLEYIDQLAHNGAQGIVLACTELPFLIRQADTDVKIFDTTTIHAQKALDLALE